MDGWWYQVGGLRMTGLFSNDERYAVKTAISPMRCMAEGKVYRSPRCNGSIAPGEEYVSFLERESECGGNFALCANCALRLVSKVSIGEKE
jgi:hypothetical protein